MKQALAAISLLAIAPSAASWSVDRGFLALHTDMRPEVVAQSLVKVEDEWRGQALEFDHCNATVAHGSASEDKGTCSSGPLAFKRSCGVVVGAVVQSSAGDRRVVSEYMDNICGVSVLKGWRKERCQTLALVVTTVMTEDSYDNRERLDIGSLCHMFWTRFTKEERKRLEEEHHEQEAADLRLDARRKAEVEAKKESSEALAEESRKKEREAVKLAAEKKRQAEEAQQKADEASKRLVQKKAEAERQTQEAQRKLQEVADSAAKRVEADKKRVEAEKASVKASASKDLASVKLANTVKASASKELKAFHSNVTVVPVNQKLAATKQGMAPAPSVVPAAKSAKKEDEEARKVLAEASAALAEAPVSEARAAASKSGSGGR